MLDEMKKFYSIEFEDDPDVRNMWFILWYYFLPKVNPNWKSFFRVKTIKNKESIYDYITTSDEAITLWFLDLWLPKVKELHEQKWPTIPKSTGEGDQVSRTKKKEYAIIYKKINDCKKINRGEVAFRWSNIFWEELVKRNPSLFKSEVTQKKNVNLNDEQNEEAIFLPGIDEEDSELKQYFNTRQTSDIIYTPMTVALSDDSKNNNEFADIIGEEKNIPKSPKETSNNNIIYNKETDGEEKLQAENQVSKNEGETIINIAGEDVNVPVVRI
jgi:hypothetical protein